MDVLASHPKVNRSRIGCIGHSIGSFYTRVLAAFEPRVRAVVCSNLDSFKTYAAANEAGGGGYNLKSLDFIPRMRTPPFRDSADTMPFDTVEILRSLAPRPIFVNAPLRNGYAPDCSLKDLSEPLRKTCDIATRHGVPQQAARAWIEQVRKTYREIFGAGSNVCAVYPDSDHDFPDRARKSAYDFLEKFL
jgi:pimeloyl-ACP methyl ester carboxylesterase